MRMSCDPDTLALPVLPSADENVRSLRSLHASFLRMSTERLNRSSPARGSVSPAIAPEPTGSIANVVTPASVALPSQHVEEDVLADSD